MRENEAPSGSDIAWLPDGFYGRRHRWLLAVGRDRRLGPHTACVALEIADHARPSSVHPFPSQQRLANALGLTERTIRRLVRELVKFGYLHVVTGKGRRQVNRYRLTLNGEPIFKSEYRTGVSSFPGKKPDSCDRFSAGKSGQKRPQKADTSDLQKLKANLNGEPSKQSPRGGDRLPKEVNQSRDAVDDDAWRKLIRRYQCSGSWPPGLGPPPGANGCMAPSAVVLELIEDAL